MTLTRARFAPLGPRPGSAPTFSRPALMYLVLLAWAYVVVMMAIAEALSPQGTVLGAFFTLLLYGVGPMGLAIYLMGTPLRRKARRRQAALPGSSDAPDGRTQPPAAAQETRVPPVREEP